MTIKKTWTLRISLILLCFAISFVSIPTSTIMAFASLEASNDSVELLVNGEAQIEKEIEVNPDTKIELLYQVELGDSSKLIKVPKGLTVKTVEADNSEIITEIQGDNSILITGSTDTDINPDVDFGVTSGVAFDTDVTEDEDILEVDFATTSDSALDAEDKDSVNKPAQPEDTTKIVELLIECDVEWDGKTELEVQIGADSFIFKTSMNGILKANGVANQYITDVTFSAGGSEASPLELKLDSNNKLSGNVSIALHFAIPDGTALTDNKMTVTVPEIFKLDNLSDGEITGAGAIVGKYSISDGQTIVVIFTPEFSALNNRNGFFWVSSNFSPTDSSQKSEVFELAGDPNNKDYTIHYKPEVIKPAFKKTFEKDGGGYKVTLSVRPGNDRPSPDTQILALTESLDKIKLDENKDVVFNGAKLVKNSALAPANAGYNYIEDNDGNATTLLHTLNANISMAGLDSYTWYDLVYYVNADSDVFTLSGNKQTLITALGNVKYTGADDTEKTISAPAEARKTAEMSTTMITSKYEAVAGTKDLLKWTVELNIPEINIINPTIGIKYGKQSYGPEKYLTLLNNELYNGTTYGITYSESGVGSDHPMVFTGTGADKTFTSSAWNTSGFTNKRTITFYTKISEDFFKEINDDYRFKMAINMDWWPNGTGNGPSHPNNENVELQQPPSSNVIVKKTLSSYDAQTGIATWNIEVNKSLNDIGAVTVEDTLSDGQTFISVTAKSDNGSGATEYTDFTADSITATDKITITTNSSVGKNKIIFELKTQLSNEQDYNQGSFYAANEQITLKNNAAASGLGITSGAASNVSEKKPNNMFKKTAENYDIINREVTWKLDLNQSKKPMTDVTLTDIVNPSATSGVDVGHKLVDTKLYTNATCTQASGYTFTETATAGTFTLSIPNDDVSGSALVLYYKTQITKEEAFNNAGVKLNVENKARVDFKDRDNNSYYLESEAAKEVSVDVVEKKMYKTTSSGDTLLNTSQSPSISSVKNVIVVNKEYLELKNSSIVDTLSVKNRDTNSSITPLSIDLNTMTLVGYAKSAPSIEIPIEIIVGDTPPEEGKASLVMSKFDAKSGFTLILPASTSYKYQLTYTTKITNRDVRNIQIENKALYSNNGKDSSSIAKGNAEILSGGASGDKDENTNGTITITNTDENLSNVIQGARYALYNSYGALVEEGIANTAGKLVFSNLTTGTAPKPIKYYVKELMPARGYKLNIFADNFPNNPKTQEISLAEKDASEKLTVKSELIKVTIPKVLKKNQDNFDCDTKIRFDLKKDNTVIQSTEVTPGENGSHVEFAQQVPYAASGYTIVETATGFEPVVLEIEMSDNRDGTAPYDEADVTINHKSGGTFTNLNGVYTLVNKRTTNDWSFELKDLTNGKLLSGVTFELYKNSNLLDTKEATNDTKTVVFQSIDKNTEYTVKAKYTDADGIYDVATFYNGTNNVFKATSEGTSLHHTFEIARKTGDLKVTMIDASTAEPNGINLKLKNATIVLVDSKGTEVSRITSDGLSLGEIEFQNLAYGESYTINVKNEKFTAVGTDGTNTEYTPSIETLKTSFTFNSALDNKEADTKGLTVYADTGAIGSVTVIKKWQNTNAPIAGVEVALMQKVRHFGMKQPRIAGGEIYEQIATGITDANGQVTFENLIMGVKYRVEEIHDPNNSAGVPQNPNANTDVFTPTVDKPHGEHTLVIKPQSPNRPSDSDNGYEESSSSSSSSSSSEAMKPKPEQKADVPKLPETGEASNMLNYLIGAMLVLIGGGILFYSIKMSPKRK